MCDDDSLDDMLAYRLRVEALSRRGFGAMTVGAGLASLLSAACKGSDSQPPPATAAAPTAAGAASTLESEVRIPTPDGTCDAYFVHPAAGAAPAVLVWPDIFGLRPAFRQMGKRLAEAGYAVLVVNPFYRKSPAPTSVPHADMDDPATRSAMMALMQSLTADTAGTDAKAFTAWLDQQPAVDKVRKMATIGYCMGGPLVLRTAAAIPDRIGAAATFHGGGLVTDKPDSPHLLIPRMKAHALIAIASNDDAKQPEAKGVLKDAFAQASLPAEIEVYAGALHGWCPPDSHVYNQGGGREGVGPAARAARGLAGLSRAPHATQAPFGSPDHLISASRSPCSGSPLRPTPHTRRAEPAPQEEPRPRR